MYGCCVESLAMVTSATHQPDVMITAGVSLFTHTLMYVLLSVLQNACPRYTYYTSRHSASPCQNIIQAYTYNFLIL